jgi:hypothetical protein
VNATVESTRKEDTLIVGSQKGVENGQKKMDSNYAAFVPPSLSAESGTDVVKRNAGGEILIR